MNFSSGGAFSLLRILNSLSKTVGIVREVKPIYQDLAPLFKGVPKLFSRLNEIRNNMYNFKSQVTSLPTTQNYSNDTKSPTFFQ